VKLKDKQEEQYQIEGFRSGNEQMLSYFFDLHYKSLCYFAGRLLQDEHQAKDIVSGCFVKLWERHADFETAQNIKAFLYISCRNACLDYLKHLKRKTAAQELYFNQLNGEEENILFQIIETEILEILSKEIELLPPKCKEVFKMIYFDGKKTDEIADQLGLSVQTIRNHKTKAIELLKNQLLKKGVSSAVYLAFVFFIDRS